VLRYDEVFAEETCVGAIQDANDFQLDVVADLLINAQPNDLAAEDAQIKEHMQVCTLQLVWLRRSAVCHAVRRRWPR